MPTLTADEVATDFPAQLSSHLANLLLDALVGAMRKLAVVQDGPDTLVGPEVKGAKNCSNHVQQHCGTHSLCAKHHCSFIAAS